MKRYVVLVFLLIALAFFLYLGFLLWMGPAPDVVIPLQNYRGQLYDVRVLRAPQARIYVDFAEVSDWGSDAVIGCGFRGIKAWRPDPNGSGMYQYASIDYGKIYWHTYQMVDRNLVVHLLLPDWVVIGDIILGFVVVLLSASMLISGGGPAENQKNKILRN